MFSNKIRATAARKMEKMTLHIRKQMVVHLKQSYDAMRQRCMLSH